MKRRIVTAREQVGMLSPWRTAAPPSGGRPRVTTREVINAVRDRHGIDLEMVNAGGGCYVLEGRLEDGSWVRAADHNDFCYQELADRHAEEERDGEPGGWDVSFHSNEHDPGGSWTHPRTGEVHEYGPSDTWASDYVEPIHWHSDPDARVDELPRVISDAFATMPHDAKRKHQDNLREQLTRSGWGPGDEEWERHFPGEGPGGDGGRGIPDYENLVNPRQDLDDDFGDIFGGRP